jgi:hypothetical protein
MSNIPIGFRIIGLRAKYRFVCLFFLANGMAIIFLSLYVSTLFLVALLILLLVCGFYAINLRGGAGILHGTLSGVSA